MWSCIEKRELGENGEGAKGKTQRQSTGGEREKIRKGKAETSLPWLEERVLEWSGLVP